MVRARPERRSGGAADALQIGRIGSAGGISQPAIGAANTWRRAGPAQAEITARLRPPRLA